MTKKTDQANHVISFIVTVRDDQRIFDCVQSFLEMAETEKAELIVVCGKTPLPMLERLNEVAQAYANVSILHAPEKERCYRKDMGVTAAVSIGYGTGWSFRSYKNKQTAEQKLWRYIPPFPYRPQFGITYFFFAIGQWLVITSGFLIGLKQMYRPGWDDVVDPGWDEKTRVGYFLLFNLINFSYWGDPHWFIYDEGKKIQGSRAMMTILRKAVTAGYPLLDTGLWRF